MLDWPFLGLNFGMIAPILDQRDRVPICARAAKLVNAAASAVPIVRRERYRHYAPSPTVIPPTWGSRISGLRLIVRFIVFLLGRGHFQP